jgi:3-methyladenine DNA glycosylase AlkD
MTTTEVMAELKRLGSEQTRKTFARHGAPDDLFGVKVGDMKVLQKKIKKDHALALDLYRTGNSDAMYFAALIADDLKFTKKDLQEWADGATWYMLTQYSVAWVAAGSLHGWDMALKWIESKQETIAVAGWSTLGCLVGVKPDAELDHAALGKLLDRVAMTIHKQPDRVKYAMNGFVIALGGSVEGFYEMAVAAAKTIGKVDVDMGDTSCRVPDAVPYLAKMKARGLGRKRKSAKC